MGDTALARRSTGADAPLPAPAAAMSAIQESASVAGRNTLTCSRSGIPRSSHSGAVARILYTPDDDSWLSDSLCILRAQIEAFAATPLDVQARARQGGAKKPPQVGQVGFRCVHCAHLPLEDRARGAVSYPNSTRLLHQAVRNWQRYHFPQCPEIPASAKERFNSARGRKKASKKDSNEYWVESCERMGLVDSGNGLDGIRFTCTSTPDSPGIRSTSARIRTSSNVGTFGDDDDDDDDNVNVQAGADAVAAAVDDTHASSTEVHVDLAGASDAKLNAASGTIISSIDAASDADMPWRTSFRSSDASSDFGIDADAFPSHSSTSRSNLLDETGTGSTMSNDSDGWATISNPFDRDFADSASVDALDNLIHSSADDEALISGRTQASLDVNLSTTSTPIAATEATRVVGDAAQDGNESLLDSIRAALDLAKSVREGHDGGVAHYRTCISAEVCLLSGGDIRSDLIYLGSTLYKVFAGVDPSETGSAGQAEAAATTASHGSSMREAKQMKTKERRADRQAYAPLRDLGLPVSLCILVSSLMDVKDGDAADRYKTAEEVEEDLSLMTIDPQRYLFDGEGGLSGRLESLEGRLYGREQDISMLMGVFDRVIQLDNPSEMVLISGQSGTGKSALIEQLRRPLYEKKGHFISVKFDELGQVQPMAAIFSAFNEFCSELVEGDEFCIAQVRSALDRALGAHADVLMDLIPNLRKVIGEPTSVATRVKGREGLNQFIFFFRVFVRAIASPSHPVVVFLDDLQWADKASLELLSTIVIGSNVVSLLFVGCYRGNEVDRGHPLNEELKKIVVAGVALTTVTISNINRDSVNALVSDTLHLSPRVTRSLADIMHTKTSGNPLFVVQFLRSLCDEHLLKYSASSRRWDWDVEAIEAKDIADNVVDLMSKKMLKLDPDVQWLLKLAACLGSRSEGSTLKLLSSSGDEDDGSGIIAFFELAVNEGLMSRMGTCYKFSHDQIQQAAYSLIPEGDRDAWHLRIGKLLWKKASDNELDKIIFIVVDQLHRGSNLISDHDEKVEVAHLCLTAGGKAMSSSAFLQASTCLLQGSTLLHESDWENNYDLSLELFTCCAEAQFACGNSNGATITLDPILKYGRCLQDKLRACYTLLRSLGTQGKQVDAIKQGRAILAQLGESFPDEPAKADVAKDFRKTRAMLEIGTSEDILQMNAMEDSKMVAVMKILYISSRYAYQVNQPLMALMVFRMLQLSLDHGICRETPYSISMFGLVLCTFGELEKASECGKLALSVLEKCKAKEYLALVSTVVYGLINVYSAPMQSNLPLIRHGHEVGVSMGDIEGALTAAVVYVSNAIQSGNQLGPLAEEVRAHMQQMKEYKHQMLRGVILPYYQAILNLTGATDDPTDLSGDAMDQDELLNFALEKELLNVTDHVLLLRLWLAYLFRRYDVASEMVKYRREMSKTRPNRVESLAFETFYTGLTAVVMAHNGEEGEWRRIALEAVENMKTWADSSSWNFQHKLDLMNAETAYYLDGDANAAAKAYDDAIRSAGEHKFVHEQALACELAGEFHSKASSANIADEYFRRAKIHYLEWGATRKAAEISLQHLGNME